MEDITISKSQGFISIEKEGEKKVRASTSNLNIAMPCRFKAIFEYSVHDIVKLN